MKKVTWFISLLVLVAGAYAQGYYVEYTITTAKGEQGGYLGHVKSYAQDGNSRIEMKMNAPVLGEVSIVNLSLKSSPNTVYMLNEKDKTYVELSSVNDEDRKDYPESEYEVTVIGKEKVNGYNCTHITVKRKGGKTDMHMWTTTEIDGYAELARIKTKYTGKDNLLKAMEAKGATGFPVRVSGTENGYTFKMDLVKAEKRTNPSALFALSGYTKSDTVNMGSMGVDMNEMIKKMQNMTPEERERMIKELQEKYQRK